MARRSPRQQYTTAQLGRMSNKQLRTAGFIRVAGFTRDDGTKVKSHTRKLSAPEKSARDSQAARKVAGNIIDFVPIIGDAKAFIDSAEAFNDNQKLAGTVLAVAGVVGLVPFVGDVVAKPLKILAKTLKSPSKSTHALAVDKVLSGGKLKFDKSTSLINRPVKIPAAAAVKTPATITRKSLVKAKQAEKKLEDLKQELTILNRGNDVLARSGKRTMKQIDDFHDKAQAVIRQMVATRRELVVAKTGLLRETPALRVVRKDLVKQHDALNLKINKLVNGNYIEHNLPEAVVNARVSKLFAKRDILEPKLAEANALAYGGRSAKEVTAAKKLMAKSDAEYEVISDAQRKIRMKIRTVKDPKVKDALRAKIRKLRADAPKVSSQDIKKYEEAQKIVNYN